MSLTDDKYVVVQGDGRDSSSTSDTVDSQDRPPTFDETDPDRSTPSLPSGISAAVLSGFVGNYYRVVEGVTNVLEDVELALPQIVVIGQESSGKSSVLESLAMMPLFPRDRDICTRMPIHLKMRHVPKSEDSDLMPHRQTEDKRQIKMKLIYSDGRDPVVSNRDFTPEEAAELMSKWMQQIVKEESQENKLQGVVDHVLEIEVRSSKVPNLNLIDLPGIVAGRLLDEPDDMMQRTRALVEKYLQMPHTLVLAVVPASERVRNSQAFQLVQQYNLMDSTIGVLTMVDRAADALDPNGPLAEVIGRLEGTSRDIVYLKEGYVAVKNRDTRLSPECSLDEFKAEENAWLEENLPGFIERGLASSSVLATKLEKMLADHVRVSWVPQTIERIRAEREKAVTKLEQLGPGAEKMVEGFLTSPTAAQQQMLQLMEPILPGLLRQIDEEMLRLAVLIHADFVHSRKEHRLLLAAFEEKLQNFGRGPSSVMAPSLLILESHRTYMTEHLDRILKNVALSIVTRIKDLIATPCEMKHKGEKSPLLENFVNLFCFFAGILWGQLNELLLDEEDLLQRMEKSFLEFDPEGKTNILKIPKLARKASSKEATRLKTVADHVKEYLESSGFHNSALSELYLPLPESSVDKYLSSDVARLVISARVPALTRGIPRVSHGGWSFPAPTNPFTSPDSQRSSPRRRSSDGPDAQAPNPSTPATPPPVGFTFKAPTFSVGLDPEKNRQPRRLLRANPRKNGRHSPSGKASEGNASAPVWSPVPNTGLYGGGLSSEFKTVGEFEARFFFALTTHVVTPLLKSISDVTELSRKMQKYVARHPSVAASQMYLFKESTSEERRKLEQLVTRLDEASVGLQSTSRLG